MKHAGIAINCRELQKIALKLHPVAADLHLVALSCANLHLFAGNSPRIRPLGEKMRTVPTCQRRRAAYFRERLSRRTGLGRFTFEAFWASHTSAMISDHSGSIASVAGIKKASGRPSCKTRNLSPCR